MEKLTPRGTLAKQFAESNSESRKKTVNTHAMMQSIISGKYLAGLAANNHISIATAVRRIAIFDSQVIQFLEHKVAKANPDWKKKMLNKVVQTSIMTDDEARQVPAIVCDILDKEARWKLQQIQDYYGLDAETMYHRISIFGLRLLEELEKVDTVDRGLKYIEIIFDAMAKSHNGMRTETALITAEGEQETIHKQNIDNMLLVDNIYPPTKWVVANGKLW